MFDQVLVPYCQAVGLALQLQQEMLRPWINLMLRPGANPWLLAMAAREQRRGRGPEVGDRRREALDAPSRSGTPMIEDATRIPGAATDPRRRGDADVHPGAARGMPRPPHVAPAAPPPRTGEGATIRLHAEELHPHKQFVETGEVRVRKELVTEHRTIAVPVQREEIVIEWRAPAGGARPAPAGAAVSASDLRPGEELRISVREERVTVERRPVVTEEVRVGKRVVQGTERVDGAVRKEEVRIEREGDVDIHHPGNGESPT